MNTSNPLVNSDKRTQDTDSLDEILKDLAILELRDNCVAFFIEASEGKIYSRTPSLALRLPHEDYVIVVKPTHERRGGISTERAMRQQRHSSKWQGCL